MAYRFSTFSTARCSGELKSPVDRFMVASPNRAISREASMTPGALSVDEDSESQRRLFGDFGNQSGFTMDRVLDFGGYQFGANHWAADQQSTASNGASRLDYAVKASHRKPPVTRHTQASPEINSQPRPTSGGIDVLLPASPEHTASRRRHGPVPNLFFMALIFHAQLWLTLPRLDGGPDSCSPPSAPYRQVQTVP